MPRAFPLEVLIIVTLHSSSCRGSAMNELTASTKSLAPYFLHRAPTSLTGWSSPVLVS